MATVTITTPKSNTHQYILFHKRNFPNFFKRPIKFETFEEYGEIEFNKCYLDDKNTIKATPYEHCFRLNLPIGTMPDGEYELDEENKTEDCLVFKLKED